jgi:enterochelin esterase family protein
MLHAQRRHPHVFGGLFLQSGSFFTPKHDAQESGFPRFRRIVAFTRATLGAGRHPDPVPVILTCGVREENVHNNRLMAQALAVQGYRARLFELPDLHNFTAWRDALDPHLSDLLGEAWATT